MNRLLANTLSAMNGFIAIVIVVAFGVSGWNTIGGNTIGMIFGVLIGIGVAGLVCGVVAYLTLIERHLRVIASGCKVPAGKDVRSREQPASRSSRVDPSL
ncbi:hypothetical protein [Aureimonas altamirensis]|uniref:hypothetical protein n=1 Tax=Aureimonas altamirensis TaxID=370622 RepID=UPI003015A38C